MNLERHIKLAKYVRKLTEIIHTEPINKHKAGVTLGEIKNILDSDYHNLITDLQFSKHGHIYYGKVSWKCVCGKTNDKSISICSCGRKQIFSGSIK